jgi:steroid delta-isomerase
MMAFAESWIAAWNRRDIEAVLAHYSEDVQFVSPVARNLIGRSILQNKKELEEYWHTALARISSLEFKLDHAAWDETRRELNVVYEANLNGERKRACEIMQFDTSGRQIRGEALYGAII